MSKRTPELAHAAHLDTEVDEMKQKTINCSELRANSTMTDQMFVVVGGAAGGMQALRKRVAQFSGDLPGFFGTISAGGH